MLIKLNFVDPDQPVVDIPGVDRYDRPDENPLHVVFYDAQDQVLADLDNVAFIGSFRD
jgi:hypothetical protein